ncbi:MAG: hypothetical protein [Caudoviricetes sp.]|nr:MAG: hypothetical protein [Caudoviricetes sp.]
MLNMKLIEAALGLIEERNEIEGITNNRENYSNIVLEWYNHSDITDAETLAALALDGKNYNSTMRYNEIKRIKELYFGSIDDLINSPYSPEEYYLDYMEKYGIDEIEMAQRDMEWW